MLARDLCNCEGVAANEFGAETLHRDSEKHFLHGVALVGVAVGHEFGLRS